MCSAEQGPITQCWAEAKGMNEETDLPITCEVKATNRTQTSKVQNDRIKSDIS